MDKICSSEKGRFCKADKAFGYLQHSFFSQLLRKKFHGGNWAEKAKLAATNLAGKVLRILFTAQDGSATRTCLKENPSTNEQVADRQLIEISYTKSTEK